MIISLNFTKAQAEMLEKILGEWEEEEGNHSCNDPTYPEHWTKAEQEEFDRELFTTWVIKDEPDREDDEPFCLEGDYIRFMRAKVKEALAANKE
jgi:hypothetical protein